MSYLSVCLNVLSAKLQTYLTHQVSSKFNFDSHSSTLFEMKTKLFINFLKQVYHTKINGHKTC